MAKVIDENTKEEKEIQDGELMRDACEELGVPFACKEGICGSCMIDIAEGEENLSELTQEEKDLARDKKHRLACQCKIKSGLVKINF